MKKITFFFALITAASFSKAQGLQNVVVEKYYSTNSADSIWAASNSAVTPLHKGSTTYRVFIDMAPGYKFVQIFGSATHPMVIKTTTNFYNDPNNGQAIGPQQNSVNNTKQGTTLIDSYLTTGGVCAGKMAVLKTEDTDGSIGNTNSILTNTLGGIFGAAINSVVPGAADGLMPGTPLAPTALGIGTAGSASDVFDQSAGGLCTCTNCAVSGLGGVVGVTPSNMVLIGQFTTDGAFSFSLNVQITPTVNPLLSEIYVPSNAQGSETVFPALSYSTTSTVTTGIEMVSTSNEISLLSVYPNPTNGIFTISVANTKESLTNSYSVYDITGRLVFTKNIGKVPSRFSEQVDLTSLNNGLYFVTVSLDGISSTRRIVKE